MFIQRIAKTGNYYFFAGKGQKAMLNCKNLACLETDVIRALAGQPEKQKKAAAAFKKYRR